jgi:hypothetical protein
MGCEFVRQRSTPLSVPEGGPQKASPQWPWEGHGDTPVMLRAAGAQRLRPPAVCLPLAARGSSWNLWSIYEEILEDEPTLSAIELTATTTAHELALWLALPNQGAQPFSHPLAAGGIVNRKSVPYSVAGVAQSFPPCASTMLRQIDIVQQIHWVR